MFLDVYIIIFQFSIYICPLSSAAKSGISPLIFLYLLQSVHPHWTQLLQGTAPKAVFDTSVDPLLSTTWGQDPYYNALCPDSAGTGVMTLAGCVATAMGRVMKYWNWPDTGVGSHSYSCAQYGTQSADFGSTAYDWAHMPNVLTAASSAAEVSAVATLLYHCGVAVDMGYGTSSQDGSGSYVIIANHDLDYSCAENALRTYFKYSPAMTGVKRVLYSDDEWAALLKNDLDNERPVLYCGYGDWGGHAFVCDGYDTNGFFHFNWGYDGVDDGFFSLSDLTLNTFFFSFNHHHAAILGLEPDARYGSTASCTVSAVSADTTEGSVVGGGTYAYRDTVTLTATPADGYVFHHWSNGVTRNPYRLLAHDVDLYAVFKGGLQETGDTLSFCGRNITDIGLYYLRPHDRIGMRVPAQFLQGHDSLTAVDVVMHDNTVQVDIHIGGDEAPGPVVQSLQHYGGDDMVFAWHHLVLDSPIALPPDSNLWVTAHFLEYDIIYGIEGIDAPDGNWFSNDSGATWGHLTDYEKSSSYCDPDVVWFIRCITKPAGSDVAIAEIVQSDLRIVNHGLDITVENPNGERVQIYDITGRPLAASRRSTFSYRFSAPGVYLLQSAGYPARKIVALRQ